MWGEVDELLAKPSAKSQLVNEKVRFVACLCHVTIAIALILIDLKFKNKEDVLHREFCEWGLRADCKRRHAPNHYCTKVFDRCFMLLLTCIPVILTLQ